MMRQRTLVTLVAVLSLAGSACGSGLANAFNPRFPDNEKGPTRRVAERLPPPTEHEGTKSGLGKPVAVATTLEEPRKLVAFDLTSGGRLWERPLEAMTRPEVLGDVVATSDREKLHVFDLASGEPLWTEDTEDLAYVGSAREAGLLVHVESVGASGGAKRVGVVTAVDARTGREKWRYEAEGAVFARPAVRGGYVFVPWNRQNITVIDLHTGFEKARLRSTDDIIDWTFATNAGVFYGSATPCTTPDCNGQGIYRLSPSSFHGTKKESDYRPRPIPHAPRDPSVHENGFIPLAGIRSARNRIRIYFSPAPVPAGTRAIPVQGDTVYFAYYRYIFAFDDDDRLKWVRILDDDVINASPLPTGLLTVGEGGEVRLLDIDTGNDRGTVELGTKLASVGLAAAGFETGEGKKEARGLRTSLNEVALDPDNRLVPARAFAVDLLASMEEPEITRDLLDIYAQRATPRALKEAIGQALRTRRTGARFLVEALDQHYDYLEGTRSPPLEVIIPPLLELDAKEAIPGLISQMKDPATPLEVLPVVVEAIVKLGGESVVPALESFVVRYHADSTFEEKPEALAAAAKGLFDHAGAEGRELLGALISDRTTHKKLATHMTGFFEAEKKATEERARAEAQAAADAAARAARREAEARPEQLSPKVINQTFVAHADAIRTCILSELERDPELAQVRFVFILEQDGKAHDVAITPDSPELKACLGPVVQRIDFPKFKQRRQHATFTVGVKDSSAGPVEEEEESGPWWALAKKHAGENPHPSGPAWWSGRAPASAAPTAAETAGAAATSELPWWMRPKEPATPTPPSASAEPSVPTPSAGTPGETTPGATPAAAAPDEEEKKKKEPAEEPPPPEEPWWLPTEE